MKLSCMGLSSTTTAADCGDSAVSDVSFSSLRKNAALEECPNYFGFRLSPVNRNVNADLRSALYLLSSAAKR